MRNQVRRDGRGGKRRGLRLAFEELSRRDMLAPLVSVAEVEGNDTAETSQLLRGPSGFLVRGRIAQFGDVDSYSFTAARGVSVVLNTRAASLTGRPATEFAPRMTVHAPDGSLIATTARGGSGSTRAAGFSFRAATGGVYRVTVEGRQGDVAVGTTTGRYLLRVEKAPPASGLSPQTVPVEADVLTRLAMYQPASATPQVSDWKPLVAGDSRLAGKNVYVAVHGWATDYAGVPALNGTNADPLKWWETIDYQQLETPTSPVTGTPITLEEPVASYMFLPQVGENTPEKTPVSPAGLAWQLLQSDPNAVVLAYSWIDDSATTLPAPSEARTALNGARLARALTEALPAGPALESAGGGLHLIGHSHGSKVAAVAATLLRPAGRTVNHLTILDSPEQGSSVTEFNATNDLWYFLSGLNIKRDQSAGTTFVDNYTSQLNRPLGLLQGYDPFASSAVKVSALQQIVDVGLNPQPLLPASPKATDAFAHRYAPSWYAGGSSSWASNPVAAVANQWSPLVTNPSVTKPLAGSFAQAWKSAAEPQFTLTPSAVPNTPVYDPAPTALTLKPVVVRPTPAPPFTGTVALAGNGRGQAVSQAFTFKTPALSTTDSFGISFNLQFTQFESDDQLQITVNTGAGQAQKEVFVMTGEDLGTSQGLATLSLGSLAKHPGLFRTKTIVFTLVPADGSQCRTTVNVSNIKQFVVPGA